MSHVTVDLGRAASELDLDRRLREIPSSASVRGVFFNMIEEDLKRRGLELAWRAAGGGPRRSYLLYSVRDFLSVYTQAGALVDADAREGVRSIFGGGSRYFGTSLLGKTFQRLLRPDPTAAFLWLERSREHLCNYGSWRVEQRGRGHVVLHMVDEYIWIDTAHRGGCEGMLQACGVVGEVHPELDSPFRGRLDVRWKQLS
jgi:uncharacterized protein (TIGR02265 family)